MYVDMEQTELDWKHEKLNWKICSPLSSDQFLKGTALEWGNRDSFEGQN